MIEKNNRKYLCVFLGIIIISIFTLTIAYAALNTILTIKGNAEVVASSWNIYLDNIKVNDNSVGNTIPTITNATTATFQTTLNMPGDFYEFTIEVVNDGSIDAMIDSIEKKPQLTTEQAKYINYIIEYENGEQINTKQLVEAKSFVRLKVRVEYRKDITTSDLPTTLETLNLSFKVNYTQSDDTGNAVKDDGKGTIIRKISGDYDTIGSEFCINKECFYVISSDDNTVTLFSKYNLYAGGQYNSDTSTWTAYGEEATGIQNSTMLGLNSDSNLYNGTIAFASTNYYHYEGRTYSKFNYVYDSNSNLYVHVENYKSYLQDQGININLARLIKGDELVELGCDIETDFVCTTSQYPWVYTSAYWTGDASSELFLWHVAVRGRVSWLGSGYKDNKRSGIRPVIVINKEEFMKVK